MVTKIFLLSQLLQALATNQPQTLELQNSIVSPYSLALPPGYSLTGTSKDTCMLSFSNGDGIGLSADNSIKDLSIIAPPSSRAVFTLTGRADMGTVTLSDLCVTGQVSLMLRQGSDHLTVHADNVDVVACDARYYSEQPQKYGVNAHQGAFTVYNFNNDPQSNISARLSNINVGRKNAPVLGSGIFISGFNDAGGGVTLDSLSTGAVYSNGMLSEGTADIINGGVFIVYNVKAGSVTNNGEVVTYGVNDMVLDNWGEVKDWTANSQLTSYGPSGIGFVNFGTVENFIAKETIETHGLGARGFNQYDGTISSARFKSIVTHGDGAIGVQISKPVGNIEVDGDITTYGSLGNSLVKGVSTLLPAIAFSVKPGGEVQSLSVKGDIASHGASVQTYAVEGGQVDRLSVGGRILASGEKADAIVLKEGGKTALTKVKAHSTNGMALVNEGGTVTDESGFEQQPKS